MKRARRALVVLLACSSASASLYAQSPPAATQPTAPAAAATTAPATTAPVTTAPATTASVTTAPANAPPLPAAGEAQRVLLQPLVTLGASAQLAQTVEHAVLVELGRHPQLDVISPAELAQVLSAEQQNAELGCDELDQCLVELQRILKVDQRVLPKLVQFGTEQELTLSLLDLRRPSVVRRADARGAGWAELAPQIPGLVAEMLGAQPQQQSFRLQPGSELKLALLPLAAAGVPEATALAMDQILTLAFSRVSGLSVLSREDVESLVQAIAARGELGCTDDFACIAEIGAELGLSKVVAGSVGQMGSTHLVSLRLIDTRAVRVQSRALEDFEGDALELRHAVRKAALDLIGVDQSQPQGGVDLTLNAASGSGRIGNRPLVFAQHRLSLQGLTPGRYDLELLPDDAFLPLRRDVYVPVGGLNARSLQLEPAPAKWYQSWWLWGAVGLVAAASTTALLITMDDDPPPPGATVVARPANME
jgi:TolB-like protein